jgi:hypothetical protein
MTACGHPKRVAIGVTVRITMGKCDGYLEKVLARFLKLL